MSGGGQRRGLDWGADLAGAIPSYPPPGGCVGRAGCVRQGGGRGEMGEGVSASQRARQTERHGGEVGGVGWAGGGGLRG